MQERSEPGGFLPTRRAPLLRAKGVEMDADILSSRQARVNPGVPGPAHATPSGLIHNILSLIGGSKGLVFRRVLALNGGHGWIDGRDRF